MLSLRDIQNQRFVRVAIIICGAALYAAFCLTLLQEGALKVTPSAFSLLMGIWIAGLLVLLLADGSGHGRFDGTALTFSKASWCNVGIVLTALLVPHPMRLWILVTPLFGVLWAALHLERRQVLLVSLVTWLTYTTGTLLLAGFGVFELVTEASTFLVFSLLLAGMVYMAGEITALRSAFNHREDELESALERLSELAMRDELTGLYNRRYIMELLNRQKALADRGHLGFALCYCDLDHFKRVNDRFGHHVGDAVLERFAALADGVVRSVDYVARLGGEEFLLVLVGADAGMAAQVAERLSGRTRSMPVTDEEPSYRLTVSTGVATFQPGERIEDVIQRADRALYEAKSQGRDGVVIAP